MRMNLLLLLLLLLLMITSLVMAEETTALPFSRNLKKQKQQQKKQKKKQQKKKKKATKESGCAGTPPPIEWLYKEGVCEDNVLYTRGRKRLGVKFATSAECLEMCAQDPRCDHFEVAASTQECQLYVSSPIVNGASAEGKGYKPLPETGPFDSSNKGEMCDNSCPFARDGHCDDGSEGAYSSLCEPGTDCADCGVRETRCDNACTEELARELLEGEDTSINAHDGVCDDGGTGAQFASCDLGRDCADCGPRVVRKSGKCEGKSCAAAYCYVKRDWKAGLGCSCLTPQHCNKDTGQACVYGDKGTKRCFECDGCDPDTDGHEDHAGLPATCGPIDRYGYKVQYRWTKGKKTSIKSAKICYKPEGKNNPKVCKDITIDPDYSPFKEEEASRRLEDWLGR